MPSPLPLRTLLWIDCGAALLAGVVVSLLSRWLSDLYAMPRGLIVAMALANLAYGTFSLSLARRASAPRSLIVLLVVANGAWAGGCALAAVLLAGTASAFGLAHLVGESLFVGGLAWLEWNRTPPLRLAEAER